ncbi:amino acid kinase family protein [Candidatus Thiodiazotropha sp. CDECU1]|uniref:amino acid kinase family protein n=1 Tax=Candidatus Thiodiazotropha sp. CDECU1 TaxID=3065865 RepID=UPI00292D4A4D|nr:amino acid kinase [Candidatus Thiodiazotropha sp. CDECU1]
MWVVKLGGSLFTSDHLTKWLTLLAQTQALVIVPGGGPFADQVRQAQQQLQFDESTAHRMALLAMEQFGRMLCGLQPGLTATANPLQMEDALKRGETPVWMPTAMTMAAADVEHSWDLTSDSLAVWLCNQLGAQNLILVKSLSLDCESLSLDELTARNIVDNRFGSYLRSSAIQALVMADCEHAHFTQVYAGNSAVATRIVIGPED